MRIDVVSQVVIDRTEDADFRVNFNVTFPELSCEQVSVDIMDAIGHRSMNLSEHGCEGSGKMGGWCYVINKYSTIEGHSLQLAGSQYARTDPKKEGKSVVGGYKRYMMSDFGAAPPARAAREVLATPRARADAARDSRPAQRARRSWTRTTRSRTRPRASTGSTWTGC